MVFLAPGTGLRGVQAAGKEWFGGLTRSAGEPEKEAHPGQRASSQHHRQGAGGTVHTAGPLVPARVSKVSSKALHSSLGLWTRLAGDHENHSTTCVSKFCARVLGAHGQAHYLTQWHTGFSAGASSAPVVGVA